MLRHAEPPNYSPLLLPLRYYHIALLKQAPFQHLKAQPSAFDNMGKLHHFRVRVSKPHPESIVSLRNGSCTVHVQCQDSPRMQLFFATSRIKLVARSPRGQAWTASTRANPRLRDGFQTLAHLERMKGVFAAHSEIIEH